MLAKAPFILVGGTNGKGTVAANLAYHLYCQNYKVGLFLSPHIQHECERISINGQYIAQSDLQQRLGGFPLLSKGAYFKAMTQIAWEYFNEQHIDIAVIEVGLGGRLDPTNIGDPLLSVITSIDLDHQAELGDSEAKILLEKLPIARAERPLVFAETKPELLSIAKSWCLQQQVHLHRINNDHLPVAEATVQGCLEILTQLGWIKTQPQVWTPIALPARQQRLQHFIIDMAHNDAALRHLGSVVPPGFDLILAKPRLRLWQDGFKLLLQGARQIYLPQMIDDEPNYFTPVAELAALLKSHGVVGRWVDSVAVAMQVASAPCLICGSARLAGMALTQLDYSSIAKPLFA